MGHALKKITSGFALVGTLLTLSSPAYAYLDPGTGSMLLQGLIAGVAAGATVISMNYHRLKVKILNFLGRNEDKNSSK